MHLSAAVEGAVDDAVVRVITAHCSIRLARVFSRGGKSQIRKRFNSYVEAAKYSPWLVLVDLDEDVECAPALVQDWEVESPPLLCFRIAVREIEAWLLADRDAMARFLGVSVSTIPMKPDEVLNPKQRIVNLARRSRRRQIAEDMVPTAKSGRQVGAAYSSRMIEFVTEYWRPEVAIESSDSLRRAVECLEKLKVTSRLLS